MKRVFITTPTFCKVSDVPMQMLVDAGFEVDWIRGATEEQILEHITDADAVINAVEPISHEAIKRAKKLKVISHHGIGLDNIDVEFARKKGIAVYNTKGCNTEAVADQTFLLAMAAARRLNEAQEAVNSGEWKKPIGYPVWCATMGIIGMGSIGKAVALRALGFNMKVLGFDIYWDEKFAKEHGIIHAELDDIYRQSDFITLHCNLTEDNRGMISINEMEKMKSSVVIVNAARGPLINERDLYTAVKNGIIAGAGLDVFDIEPTPVENPLLTLSNVIRTPHNAQYTSDCLDLVSKTAVQNVLKAF